jgi:hypothetical protein
MPNEIAMAATMVTTSSALSRQLFPLLLSSSPSGPSPRLPPPESESEILIGGADGSPDASVVAVLSAPARPSTHLCECILQHG